MIRYLLAAACILAAFTFLTPSCKCNRDHTAAVSDTLVTPYMKDPVIKGITEKIHADPKNPELYYQRSVAFHDMQKVVPAYTDVKHAIELDSTKPKYYFLQADIMMSDGYADGAAKSYERILQLEPTNTEARTKLAKTYLFAGDHDASLQELKKLIEQDKNNFEPYFLAGLNYKEMGDTANAVKSFHDALQFKPDLYDAYVQLGLLAFKKNSPEAPQYFDNAIRLDSTKTESYYDKGKYYQDHKQYELAKKIYRQLIRISPQNDKAFFNLGFIYLLQDSVDKAYKHFNFAVKMKPNYAEAYYYRGLCAHERGDNASAKEDLQRCLALKPDYEKAQSLLNTLNKQ